MGQATGGSLLACLFRSLFSLMIAWSDSQLMPHLLFELNRKHVGELLVVSFARSTQRQNLHYGFNTTVSVRAATWFTGVPAVPDRILIYRQDARAPA